MNPPSAWAVAKRDAPQGRRAAAGRTASPAGPKGRFAPFVPYFWGIWNFSKNQSAAKSLIMHLSQAVVGREDGRWPAAATTCRRSRSSRPSRPGPRKGRPRARSTTTPIPYNHQILSIAGAPAPHKIAEQIYTQAHADPDGRPLLQGRGRWRRRSTGRPASSKASCATEDAYARLSRGLIQRPGSGLKRGSGGPGTSTAIARMPPAQGSAASASGPRAPRPVVM